MFKKVLLSVLLTLLAINTSFGEGKQYTAEDYRKGFEFYQTIKGKVYNDKIWFHWIEDHNMFWYESNGENSRRFIMFDADTETKSDLFDHAKAAEVLAEVSGKEIDSNNLPFDNMFFDFANHTIDFNFDDARWQYQLSDNTISKLDNSGDKERRNRPDRRRWGNWLQSKAESPDGKWKAFVKDYQLWIENTDTAEQICMTNDGTETRHYDDDSFYWSPDSTKLISLIIKPVKERQVHYIESSPEDQLQPKHFTIDLPETG